MTKEQKREALRTMIEQIPEEVLAEMYETSATIVNLVNSLPNGWDCLLMLAHAKVIDAEKRADAPPDHIWTYNPEPGNA